MLSVWPRFTNWILSSLKNNKMVDPFIDQFNTPTLVDDIAKTLIRIIDENISGLYHATGSTCLNRYDFALLLAKYSKLNSSLISSITQVGKSFTLSKESGQSSPFKLLYKFFKGLLSLNSVIGSSRKL